MAAKGFKIPDCSFDKTEFLNKASDITVDVEVKPRKFVKWNFGYQQKGGIRKVEAKGANGHGLGEKAAYIQPYCVARVKKCVSQLSSTEFMDKATPLKFSFVLHPHEFKAGSFGWYTSQDHDVMVDGEQVCLHVVFSAPIRGSKGKGVIRKGDAEMDPKNIHDSIPKDLHPVPGIGPTTGAVLRKMGVDTIPKLACMDTTTPATAHLIHVQTAAANIITGKQDPLEKDIVLTAEQEENDMANEQPLLARQAQDFPDVVMKSLIDGRNICKIPNGEIIYKIAEKGDSYTVRWRGHEGLVKITNTAPASEEDLKTTRL